MAELEPGQAFAGYQILQVAGQGGMGMVYRATQLRLKRTVALKLIAPDLARDDEFRARFVQESETAASIEHPNVIPIYDSGEADGTLYLAMRFIEGPDLRVLIERSGPLDPLRAARIVEQVAAALDAAHESGLVHRDVKPRNILVADQRGRDHVYLTDFGLSKRVTAETGMTRTGQWVGTIDYVSPEQIEGRKLDARADVYSLGCVLYECLTGAVPFERDSGVARLLAHLKDPPPNPTEKRPALSPQFDEVVQRALSKDPKDRYPSAGDLGRAATAAAEGRVVDAPESSVAAGDAALIEDEPAGDETVQARTRLARRKPAGETVAATAAAPAAAAPTAAARRPTSAAQRRRRALLIAGVAVVAVIGAIVLLAGGGGDGDSPSTEETTAASAPDPDPGSAPKPAADGNGIVPGSALVGVWQGTAYQLGPKVATYPVVMDIAASPAPDGSSGTTNYPSINCGGRVTIVDTGPAPIGTRYEMNENITRNAPDCAAGKVTADLQGDELRWHWHYQDYNALAVLRRLDEPEPERRSNPKLSVSELALIDGEHEGTMEQFGPKANHLKFPLIVDIESSDQPLPPGSIVGLTINPQAGCRGQLRLTERYASVFVFEEQAAGAGADRCIFGGRLEIVPWGDDMIVRSVTTSPLVRSEGVLHQVGGG